MSGFISSRAPLICAALLLVASACEAGEPRGAEFFTIRLSNEGRSSYLYGEQIFVEVEIANPTDRPLTYMAAGDVAPDGFISGVSITLTREGKPVPRTRGDVSLFPRGSLHESLVRKLPSGSSLKRRTSLENRNPVLPPGTYAARATFQEAHDMFDLARGEAVSNEIVFTIKEWRPKAYVEKSWDRKLGLYTTRETVQLVETTEGDTLISWRSVDPKRQDGERWLRIVPIKAKVLLEGLWWAVGQEVCHIVCDQVDPRRRILVMAEEATSCVSVVELEAGGAVHKPGAGAWMWWPLTPGAALLASVWFWVWGRRRRPVVAPIAPSEQPRQSLSCMSDS